MRVREKKSTDYDELVRLGVGWSLCLLALFFLRKPSQPVLIPPNWAGSLFLCFLFIDCSNLDKKTN
ncbi:hypothetical protein J3E69DRAFT_271260 [Trichoderma sp. SZMC 28015]